MDKIIILDFGGQYCHLIARRIRDFGVFAEVKPFDISANEIKKDKSIKGIILSGGAKSVYDKNAPKCKRRIFHLNIPILGICYGHQLIARLLGGKVVSGETGEYGFTNFHLGANILSGKSPPNFLFKRSGFRFYLFGFFKLSFKRY